jgi:hypothetical protein
MSFKSHKELLEALLTKKKIIDVHENTLELDKEYKLLGTFKPSYQPEDKHLLTFLNPTNWSFKKATQLVNGVEIGIPTSLNNLKKNDLYFAVSTISNKVYTEVIGDDPTKDFMYFSLCVCFTDVQDAEDYLKAVRIVPKQTSKVVEAVVEVTEEEVVKVEILPILNEVVESVTDDTNKKAYSLREKGILRLFDNMPIRSMSRIVNSKKGNFGRPPFSFGLVEKEVRSLIEQDVHNLVAEGKLVIVGYTIRELPLYALSKKRPELKLELKL